MAGGPDPLDVFSPSTLASLSADIVQRGPMPTHHRRIEWRHVAALLQYGVPIWDIYADGDFTFGIVRIKGVDLIFTEDSALRGYLHGPGLFRFPAQVAE